MKALLFFTGVFLSSMLNAQEVLNPYKSYSYLSEFNYNNSLSGYQKNFRLGPINSPYYNGEYEISLYKLPWYKLFIDPALATGQPLLFSASYTYETVSYPFQIDCAYQTGNCTNVIDPCSTQARSLSMPIEDSQHFVYNINGYFDYVNAATNDKLYVRTPLRDFSGVYSSGNMGIPNGIIGNTLVSAGFTSSVGFRQDRYILPHSILKLTINLHCGPDKTSPIISSLVYYYDNTRGKMRIYPFKDCNLPANQTDYDVIFVPEVLYGDDQYTNPYSDIILPNGTLDYFPFSEIGVDDAACSTSIIFPNPTYNYYNPENMYLYYQNNYPTSTLANQAMYNDIYSNSYLLFPNPYALNTNPLRDSYGDFFAGYEPPSSGTSNNLTLKPGIRHSYFIDQNTDLNIINPTEKEIYNPSEATITASNFVFPQDYTFKTIRGVYPSEAEALASRILENGCDANTDLREVPVKTDLTTENTTDAINFPLSALPATQHLYASRYYLENNSKLTVQNCVRLFDCTFDVKQGATLLFDDYPAHYGKEDHSFDRANTRFKIQTLGGAVLRNYNDVQYLQNGDITQTLPLHYKAVREIYAGSNVDPDQDIPKQDYVAQSGSNITLQAGEVIYLKEGFHAMSGSNVYITPTSPGGSAGPCNLPMAARMAGNRQQQQPSKNVALLGLGIYPNPASTVIKLHNNFMPLKAASVVIIDVYGRTVYEQTNFNSMLHTPDFSHKPSGMYMAKVTHHGTTETLKFMVQH